MGFAVNAGDSFGRLVVVKRNPNSFMDCVCQCGSMVRVKAGNLTSGNTKSCGCLQKDMTKIASTSHGMTKSKAYATWRSMLQRCNRDSRYKGKVFVCDRWMSFENFYSDMGDAPSGTSLDRIDGSKGYEPGNCRWATASEQAINRKTTVFIEHNGVTKCLSEWAKELGISRKTIKYRMDSGWSIADALAKGKREIKEKVLSNNTAQNKP